MGATNSGEHKPGQGNMQMSAGEHYKAFKKSHKGILAVLFVCLSLMTWSCKTGPSDSNDAEARAEKMLAQMTLDEKIGQMSQLDIGYFSDPEDLKQAVRDGRCGSLLNFFGTQQVNEIQRIAMEESRLGIPLIIGGMLFTVSAPFSRFLLAWQLHGILR